MLGVTLLYCVALRLELEKRIGVFPEVTEAMQALQGDAQGRIITAPQTSPGAQQAKPPRRGYGRRGSRTTRHSTRSISLHGPQMCADVMDIYSWISGNRVAVNPEACTKSAFAAATCDAEEGLRSVAAMCASPVPSPLSR